jgi:phage-related protein
MANGWAIEFFSPRVEAEILAMPVGLLARFVRYAERLEVFGPDLGLPHTRAMGRGLFELRLRASEGISRVFYGVLPGRRVVMLHVFIKKTQKTPVRELEIARRRMKELLDV